MIPKLRHNALPPAAGTAAAELIDVRKSYDTAAGTVAALAGVTAAFAAGTFTAVMGPSGSGKSTLLQCAAGLDRVTSGEVRIGGTPIAGLSPTALTILRRTRVGFIFQAFNLIPSLTAKQNVELPRAGWPGTGPTRRRSRRCWPRSG